MAGETSRWTMPSGLPSLPRLLVGGVQPRSHGGGDGRARAPGAGAARCATSLRSDLAQVLAVQVLHREEVGPALGRPDVVDARDVRVVQRRRHPRLVQEQLHERLAGRVLRQDPLEHDVFGEPLMPARLRQVDLRHAAGARRRTTRYLPSSCPGASDSMRCGVLTALFPQRNADACASLHRPARPGTTMSDAVETPLECGARWRYATGARAALPGACQRRCCPTASPREDRGGQHQQRQRSPLCRA